MNSRKKCQIYYRNQEQKERPICVTQQWKSTNSTMAAYGRAVGRKLQHPKQSLWEHLGFGGLREIPLGHTSSNLKQGQVDQARKNAQTPFLLSPHYQPRPFILPSSGSKMCRPMLR